jgi:hypothetical protein
MKALAERFDSIGPGKFPVTHTRDGPISLQVWMQTRQPAVGLRKAAALLAGPSPAFVVTKDVDSLRAALRADQPVYEVFTWSSKRSSVHILSNHPRLERVEVPPETSRQTR